MTIYFYNLESIFFFRYTYGKPVTGTVSLRARFSYFYGPYDYRGDVPMVTEKFNVSKKEGKDQESIQSSATPNPGYKWESDNVAIRHHK